MAVLDTEQDRFVCGATSVVELRGEIDIATAEAAYTKISAAVGSGCAVVDLSAVEFIDASGVNALVRAVHRATAARHHLTLACPPRQLVRILDVLSLHQVLPIRADLPSAVAEHGARAATR
ncbi:anti-sigma factor antagonist [Nocardiopsis algeriensis]|uniref:anti-sigma factor antagonist n=1 Tax=Nocardiopsis algeriensis TaxID=1478215 RepID=UPI00161EA468